MVPVQSGHPIRGIPVDAYEICWCTKVNDCTCDIRKSEARIDAARRARRLSKLSGGNNSFMWTGRNGYAHLCGPKVSEICRF